MKDIFKEQDSPCIRKEYFEFVTILYQTDVLDLNSFKACLSLLANQLEVKDSDEQINNCLLKAFNSHSYFQKRIIAHFDPNDLSEIENFNDSITALAGRLEFLFFAIIARYHWSDLKFLDEWGGLLDFEV